MDKKKKNIKPKMADISQKWLDLLIPFTYDYTKKYTIKELVEITKIPLRSATRYLNGLYESKLISSYKRGKTLLYYLDLKQNKTRLIINLIELYKSVKFVNNSEIWVIINDLIKFGDVILFGSYAKYYSTKESDVDILLFCKKQKKIIDLVKTYPYEINLHFSTIENFAKLLRNKNALAIEIVKAHIVFGSNKFIDLCMRYYNNEL